jgi:hypothetical protein
VIRSRRWQATRRARGTDFCPVQSDYIWKGWVELEYFPETADAFSDFLFVQP